MNVGTSITQYYLQVQALTPQSGSPLVSAPVVSSHFPFPFGLSAPQLALIGTFVLLGIIALLFALVQDIKKVLTILLIGFTTSAVPLSVGIANRRTQLSSQANSENIPKNVIVTQVIPTSFSVLWDTDQPGVGVVRVRRLSDPSVFNQITSEPEGGDIYKHMLKVVNLTPETQYALEILSNGIWYDNQGKPLEITTPAP